MSAPVLHKYVITELDSFPGPQVITHSGALQHSEVVPKSAKPISAGHFVFVEPGVPLVIARSGSDSLRLNSRPEDQALLEKFFHPSPA